MAKKGGAKKSDKGKKEDVAKKPRNLHSLFNISGDKVERKRRTCPKCGPGMFLGKHKNRLVCGKCQYVEFVKAKEE
tara:strand:- start:194 stop:421 length:228 start_codon:yes stop_codon:yes gene_type:complete